MSNSIVSEFIQHSIFRLEENTSRIKKCLDELTEADIWRRPNEASNSIGNLILHLCGNIRQYAVSSLLGIGDTRQRDLEFSATGGPSKSELFDKLSATVAQAVKVIGSMNETGLLRIRSVQGFEYSGVGIIVHVTEHYSYHTGQIAFWTKLLRNKDLGFYANFDLNIKNKPS